MFAVCNASVPLAELELESLFWPARRQRYKEFFGQSPASRRPVIEVHFLCLAGETPALQTRSQILAKRRRNSTLVVPVRRPLCQAQSSSILG